MENFEASQFTVVLRCSESRLRLPPDRGIRISPLKSDHGSFELTVLTRRETLPKFDDAIPRELWIEVVGPAPNIDVALNIASASADEYVRQIAFAANAWHGIPTIHLAYDSTPGMRDRIYFQNWIWDETGLPQVAREFDPDLIFCVIEGIAKLSNKDRSRVMGSIIQYTDALQHWKSGSELYALAHLYMGIEAITPLIIKQEVKRKNLKNRAKLEELLHGPPPDSLRLRIATKIYRWAGGHVSSKLDAWARREIIFRGDKDTYKSAKAASDQLEHGLAHHAEIHELAKASLLKTASYLRDSILSLLEITDQALQTLRNSPYSVPAGTGGFERFLVGRITAERENLASSGDLHPYVRWSVNLKNLKRLQNGAYDMTISQSITPVLAGGTQIRFDKIFLQGPTISNIAPPEINVTRGEKSTNGVVVAAGVHLTVDDPRSSKWVNPFGSFVLNCNAIPHLAHAWLSRLGSIQPAEACRMSMSESVERILEIVAADDSISSQYQECAEMWKEAADIYEASTEIRTGRTEEDRFVIPNFGEDGAPGEMTEVSKLVELNSDVVKLETGLIRALEGLLGSRRPATK